MISWVDGAIPNIIEWEGARFINSLARHTSCGCASGMEFPHSQPLYLVSAAFPLSQLGCTCLNEKPVFWSLIETTGANCFDRDPAKTFTWRSVVVGGALTINPVPVLSWH